MVTLDQAIEKVRENLPDGSINASIEWDGNYLFSVYTNDPDEGELDPFYAVNIETGLFSGFSIVGDADTDGILEAFQTQISQTQLAQSSLAHYGVKGMQWGVRNEKKPSPRRKASVAAETTLNVVKPVAGMFVPRLNVKSSLINIGLAIADGADKTMAFKAVMGSPLTIAGAAISTLDSGSYRIPFVAAKNAVSGGFRKNPELAKSKLSVDAIKKNVVSGVNKDYPGLGTTNNCLRCTYAYEMRRRGFDVAATKTMFASGQTSVFSRVQGKSLRGPKKIVNPNKPTGIKGLVDWRNKSTARDVFRTLSSQPDRSRGDLRMSWGPMLGGHSVAYEIVNKKPVIFDTQSGRTYSTPAELNQLTGRAMKLSFDRLDNKKLSSVGMTAWVKDS